MIDEIEEETSLDESTPNPEAEKNTSLEELEESKDLLSTLSLGELKKQMKEAINDENYEKASELRDEINKRKEK